MEFSYQKSIDELNSILAAIQGDKCDIDQLTSMTKRATELLAQCRGKLTATENELKDILSSLEQQ